MVKYTEPQKAAIKHLKGPCLCIASAGTGKTFVITVHNITPILFILFVYYTIRIESLFKAIW